MSTLSRKGTPIQFDIAKHLLRILQLSFANWSLPVNILVVERCLAQTIMTAKNWCYQSPTRIKNQSIIVQRNLEKCTKMADIVRKYGECIVANIGAERRSTKQQITHGHRRMDRLNKPARQLAQATWTSLCTA
ncbi:hypothetical protein Tcan_12658 [Toxocara canis]|uniref:Uncharacterized protein n=1 Tax=Toxocara canis TaxID=6265 RepID=A0A0B2V619_TOXCA|nr:hypothetical protein Tcan_12658 [Toxocara canis]